MQEKSTDSARSKEEICLDVIRSGKVSIDSEGRFWRHWRYLQGGRKREYKPARRADHPDKLGYCRIGFHSMGDQYVCFAHRLVWVYHNGPIPSGLEVNHKDGNKSNNRLDNLELVTHGENQRHAAHVTQTMRQPNCEQHSKAKLTWEKVDEMRRIRREYGTSYRWLGKMFGVSGIAARAVCLELTWRAKDRPKQAI